MLYLETLDPDIASQGGTALGPALRQGSELLRASTELADRVLVVFTDGDGHDSLEAVVTQARRLNAAGIRLILVAEGGRAPVRIPVRDDHGALQGYQKDETGALIETGRRDDILGAIADAAQGAQVAADLPDQAGAVRDLVASYKRARASETHTERGRPRAWVPLLLAVGLLIGQAATRRTAALLGAALLVAATPVSHVQAQDSSHPRTAAERAWDRGQLQQARSAYAADLASHQRDDTAWYNAGTAALAAGDRETARQNLSRAATSLAPDLRFRALYNLGLVALRDAQTDSSHRDAHLVEAERAYREALLLRPDHAAAKWNLEVAARKKRGGGGSKAQSAGGGGGGGANQSPSGSGTNASSPAPQGGGLTPTQAEQILKSIGREEVRTRRDRTGRSHVAAEPGVKDW
jgi:Ca-activated chloride channel family protein